MGERAPRIAAESVGTFMLVLIGPGAAAVDTWSHGGVSHVGIALAFGTIILAAIYAVGHISGAHLNPAVSVAFWVAGRFPGRDVAPYICAQVAGAALAGLAIRSALGVFAAGATTRPTVPAAPALAIELALTFVLMTVIMAVATDARVASPVAGLAVGATVASEALAAGPLTGASMNPARSFGPAFATGVWSAQWIYWVGPLSGAVLAVVLYDYIRRGHAVDHRTHRAARAPLSPSLPLHGQLRAQPNGGGVSQLQSARSIPR
jgi:MIP family channel proteins